MSDFGSGRLSAPAYFSCVAVLTALGLGVAVWAHVGGFVAGVLLVRAFTRPDLVEARRRMLLQRGLLQGVDGGT